MPDRTIALMVPPSRYLEERCRRFAVRVISLVGSLPGHPAAAVVGSQLVRSATTIGAQCRAARHARTRREVRAKLISAETVADESMYWLHLLIDSRVIPSMIAAPLVREAQQLTVALGRRIDGRTASPANRYAAEITRGW